MSDETTNEAGETTQDLAEVWYCTESDPFRALHDVFEVKHGDRRQLYECRGWGGRPESAVKAALGAAGFVGGSPREVGVRALSDEVDVIRHFGFHVDPGEIGAVEEALREGLMGNLGGWTSVLMGQAGFHRSVYAFAHTWAQAGKPPILLAHPPSERSRARGVGGPAALVGAHELDPRARLALSRFQQLSKQLP
jgi:hypothetical protein